MLELNPMLPLPEYIWFSDMISCIYPRALLMPKGPAIADN